MGKDIAEKKERRQAKSLLIGNDKDEISLEDRVAGYLLSKKGDKSLGVFAGELGIPKPSLKRYLESSQSMSLSTLQKIARALGVQSEVILRKNQKRP